LLIASARAFIRARWWARAQRGFGCAARAAAAETAAAAAAAAVPAAPAAPAAAAAPRPGDVVRAALREFRAEEPPESLVLAIETTKTIPLLYLILSLPMLDNYVCGLPRCLYDPPASGSTWSAFGTVPGGANAPINFQVFRDIGYTDKQIMVLWVLTSTVPNIWYMFALLAGEVCTLGFFLLNLSMLHRPRFFIPALVASGLLAVLWGCFELQTVRALHLWNTPFDATLAPTANLLNSTSQLWMDEKGVETVLCSIPFGAWTSRAFAFLHVLGALYYVYRLTPMGCCYCEGKKIELGANAPVGD